MKPDPIIILGSSQSSGGTRLAVESIIGSSAIPVVDLKKLEILPYDYEYRNKEDDYFPLMERIINHDLIVIATPVYWYSMSAIMKAFIDRLSDLLDIRKDLSRLLRGKNLFVIASFGTSLPRGFEDPFEQTCDYMGMHYQGCSFIYHGNNSELQKGNLSMIEKGRKVLFSEN